MSAICALALLPSAHAEHALALGYTPKYAPDFRHFDYVNPDAPKGGQLVLAAGGNFDSFNPFVLKAVQAAGLPLMFDSLTEKSEDEPISAYGLLAEDMSLAPDRLSVTFRLNPKARFSNGEPVTAEDVKYSFDTLRSKQAHPFFSLYWSDVKQAVIVDPRTVRFEFARQNAELHIIVSELQVFSRKWGGGKPFNQINTDHPIASGPYLIESVDLGRRIVYKRNPNYWAKDLPARRGMYNFDRIVYRYYKDNSVRLEAFKAGEFDLVVENSAKLWSKNYVGDKFDDGSIRKTTFAHRNPQGMQAFVFNLRKPKFQDKRVRKAIGLAFDFEWANRNLFERQYTRAGSFFNNSELASSGLPSAEELKLLQPFRAKLPPEVFTRAWLPPNTDAPNSLRANLVKAKQLLEQAGWRYRDKAMRNAKGEALEIEVMIGDKGFERIVLPFARNLARIGVDCKSRIVDPALFQRRFERFEFELVIDSFASSMNPGNELTNRFAAASADKEGSENSIGIKDPVVDALVDKVLTATKRSELLTAVHALDRVLLHGEYLVPNWYIPYHRVAYYDRFERPKTLPFYYAAENWALSTWWSKSKP